MGNYDRLRTESRQVGGVCRDVTAVVVKYYQLLHARTRESSHIYSAVEGHPFHKQSPGSCCYIPRVSVRKQEHPGTSQEETWYWRACTDYDSRWRAHSVCTHTSFPCHDQPRLSETVEKQGGNLNMQSGISRDDWMYGVLFIIQLYWQFSFIMGIDHFRCLRNYFYGMPFLPFCCRFEWRGRVRISAIFKNVFLRDRILNLSSETSSDTIVWP